MSAASIYEGQDNLIPVVNAFGNVFREIQLAAAGQTIVNIASFQYASGTNTLLVFRNGLLQTINSNYTETNSSRITFLSPLALNDIIIVYAYATSGSALPTGGGVPPGGTTGQALAKINNNDYATQWINLTALASLLDAPVQAVASANTVDLAPLATVSRNIIISGAVDIAGFQVASGQLFAVRVTGNFKFLNSASLNTNTGVDIVAVPGDTLFIRAVGANVVELLSYKRVILPVAEGGTGDQGTAWTSSPGVIASIGGALATASATIRWKQQGKTVWFNCIGAIVANGTGAGGIAIILPFTSKAENCFAGRESQAAGFVIGATVTANSNQLTIFKYDNTYPAGSGYRLNISGVIEVN